MSVKFPEMHIADSVVNRILNAWDDVMAEPDPTPEPEPMAEAPEMVDHVQMGGAPELADPAAAGMAVSEGLERMGGGMAPNTPEGAQVAVAVAQGESPLEGLLGAVGPGPEGP